MVDYSSSRRLASQPSLDIAPIKTQNLASSHHWQRPSVTSARETVDRGRLQLQAIGKFLDRQNGLQRGELREGAETWT
jgi:hypothetical protein